MVYCGAVGIVGGARGAGESGAAGRIFRRGGAGHGAESRAWPPVHRGNARCKVGAPVRAEAGPGQPGPHCPSDPNLGSTLRSYNT